MFSKRLFGRFTLCSCSYERWSLALVVSRYGHSVNHSEQISIYHFGIKNAGLLLIQSPGYLKFFQLMVVESSNSLRLNARGRLLPR
ncbi:hypothetical protein GCM10009114_15790 [Aliiglaciecola litoralis]|uniref:Secreted protein n=1 Tax=Aliiglaciecola litoralis TaxID=582857 RepID=A0ABP3WRW3_9ALTE